MVAKSRIEEISSGESTPFYLIDCNGLEEQYRRLKSAFPEDTLVAYATKANYTPSLIRTFRDLGTHFDVFSPGELELLIRNDCDPEKVVYTSVAETTEEFENALREGVRRFVLGSINGIKNFSEASNRVGEENTEVLVRIQPLEEVSAAVSTSGVKSKFGTVFTDDEDSAGAALGEIEDRGLDFAGFHFHLGSQVKGPQNYVRAIDNALEFVSERGLTIRTLDIGGGYPFEHGPEVKPIEDFGDEIGKCVEGWREELGEFELFVEPGRYLTANAVDLVVKVVNVKEMYGRKVVIVDGSEDMVSVSRHENFYDFEVVTDVDGTVEGVIAGNLCHSADWIVENPREIPAVELGDLVIFRNVGAYVINHNIPYNLRKIPSVISLRDGKTKSEKHPFRIVEEVNEGFRG